MQFRDSLDEEQKRQQKPVSVHSNSNQSAISGGLPFQIPTNKHAMQNLYKQQLDSFFS